MSVHQSAIRWQRKPHETDASTYSRNHCVTLSGGQQVNVGGRVQGQYP